MSPHIDRAATVPALRSWRMITEVRLRRMATCNQPCASIAKEEGPGEDRRRAPALPCERSDGGEPGVKLESLTTDPVLKELLDAWTIEAPDAASATPDCGSRDDDGDGYVQVIVNLTRRAYRALEGAQRTTGDTKTDTINRALVVYELVQRLSRGHGGTITMLDRDGNRMRLHVS